jgi:hypothetical protein
MPTKSRAIYATIQMNNCILRRLQIKKSMSVFRPQGFEFYRDGHV